MGMKSRTQPEGAGESKSKTTTATTTTTTTTTSMSIGRSMSRMTCAGSICGTKESAVLSRESCRSSGRIGASSRSLKAPDDNDTLSVSMATASSAVVSASSSFNSETTVATTATTVSSSSSSSSSSPLSSIGAGSRSFRKLSGCYYECHSVLDPRTCQLGGAAMAMLPCADCDEFFLNAESLELHRSTRHAVSELGADDTSRNVVEIIFQSSWLLRKPRTAPACRIERILKVHTSGKMVEMFEQYRERVKARAAASGATDELARRSYPRCAADGNELLRFHCTTFNGCSLGLAGTTDLCRSPSQCRLCSIVRDGFRVDGDGMITTMATSGRAHDAARLAPPSDGGEGERRAMLVCRVVAGRVKKVVSGSNSSDEFGCCDSASSSSDLDELTVFNSRAILPCFVVIYTVGAES